MGDEETVSIEDIRVIARHVGLVVPEDRLLALCVALADANRAMRDLEQLPGAPADEACGAFNPSWDAGEGDR